MVLETNVAEITANPVSDEVYGIDAAGTPGILSPEYTTEGVTQNPGATSPVLDLVTDATGVSYVISETAVSTWDPNLNSFTLIDGQPILPPAVPATEPPTPMTGTYKSIAIGMDGILYVLFENADTEQYLLKGYPPYITEGVVIDFKPKALNLSSQGNYVSIDITLPSDLAEADIDPSSLKITKIDVAGVGLAEDLAILMAPNTPYSVNSHRLRVKFYRSTKRATSEDQSISWQLQQILAGQNKGQYAATITLEGSVEGSYSKFQGEASFTAIVTKKTK
ncbi:hypothetical protein PITCH_A720023 [uncultured Desulfobacterium sp.]|uniref:Uncharacterized protein n=1 Tax=uncultured Desulfobacterium sp. TaxID=201089 RepID=A0A445N1V6_9BACT|nr:hypothetical protein PITCH_A720023 [uncultured Desulfobacterium sp.]